MKEALLEALRQYVRETTVRAPDGRLMIYCDGMPVVVHVAAAVNAIHNLTGKTENPIV